MGIGLGKYRHSVMMDRSYARVKYLLFAIFLIILFCIPLPKAAAEKGDNNLFCTWEGFEPDKCASIWLIKRFVNKDAEFLFLERGEFIEKGVAFDTPDAALRRYSDMSTFESIVKKYGITDKAVMRIGEIMHDIEINSWGKKRFEETRGVIKEVIAIIENTKSDGEVIKKSSEYFDSLYEKLLCQGDGSFDK